MFEAPFCKKTNTVTLAQHAMAAPTIAPKIRTIVPKIAESGKRVGVAVSWERVV
jgi:hypothetical protein